MSSAAFRKEETRALGLHFTFYRELNVYQLLNPVAIQWEILNIAGSIRRVCGENFRSPWLGNSSDFIWTLYKKPISEGRNEFFVWCLMGLFRTSNQLAVLLSTGILDLLQEQAFRCV